MKKILFIICIAFSINAIAQNTFNTYLIYMSDIYGIEEMPDGSFIGCGDSTSTGDGVSFKLDSYGQTKWTYIPKLHNQSTTIYDITRDPYTNGMALCGYTTDVSGNDSTGYYLLIDTMKSQVDSLFYSGGLSGPTAESIIRTTDNNFIVSIEAFLGGGSSEASANKIIYPSDTSWREIGGSSVSLNGMAIDSSNNLLFASYNPTAAASANLNLYDSGGVLLHNYSITDTIWGGSLVFSSVTAPAPDGGYMFGVNISPNTISHSVIYLSKLDTAFNLVWEKYIDWGIATHITAITPTSDSCIVLLMGTDSSTILHKMNLAGDSLWTQYYNFNGYPTYSNRFQQCADSGFVVVGSVNIGPINFGHILKTDKNGLIFPPSWILPNGNISICQGDSIQLTSASGYQHLWSTSDTTATIWVHQPGFYYVSISDGSLTSYSDTVSISFYNSVIPVISISGNDLIATGVGILQWYLNGNIIAGADSSVYTPVVNGLYTVELTDSNQCTTISAQFNMTTVSIEELPVNTRFIEESNSFILLSEEMIRKVTLIDMTGKIILSEIPNAKEFKIEKEILSTGIYIMNIEFGNGIYKMKFIR